MSSKDEVRYKIHELDIKLIEQLEAVSGMRGMHEDVVRLMVPAMRDQLALMREIADLIPNEPTK